MLKWHGKEITDKVTNATARAMDSILVDCVGPAKAVHPPQVRTGTFQGSIQMRPTQLRGPVLVGVWGSFNVLYAIYLEKGTVRIQEYAPLRKTADQLYPKLAERIRKEMG